MPGVSEPDGVRPCPNCGTAMPHDGKHVVWCDACDWNVDPSGGEPTTSRRARRAVARTVAEAERARRAAARGGRSSWGDRVLLGVPIALALGVHALTVLVLVSGVFALTQWPLVIGIPIGVSLLVGGVGLVPRPKRIRKEATVLTRETASELFALLDEVSAAEHAARIHCVVLSTQFNASTTTVGVRRRTIVIVGVPLWLALQPQERLAVLAHEVAHQVNGDIRRTSIVGTSLASLETWVVALEPRFSRGAVAALIALFLRALRGVAQGVLAVQLRLTYRSHRAAEYAADLLAARIASTDAAVSALDRMVAEPSCMRALARASRTADGSLWASLVAWREALPEREHERLRRVARMTTPHVDETHPPIMDRIDLLRSLPRDEAAIVLDDARGARIDLEILDAAVELEGELRTRLRDPNVVFG